MANGNLPASDEKIEPMNLCEKYITKRTKEVYLDNKSSWTVTVWLVQLISVVPPRPDYINDTGVFVAQTAPIGQGERDDADPCLAGGNHRPIMGTTFKCSVEAVYGERRVTKNLRDLVAPAGKYWPSHGWVLKDTASGTEFTIEAESSVDDLSSLGEIE